MIMGKTPEYTKRAIENYRAKKEYIQFSVDKGIKDRMKNAGLSTADIRSWILAELEKRENDAGELPF